MWYKYNLHLSFPRVHKFYCTGVFNFNCSFLSNIFHVFLMCVSSVNGYLIIALYHILNSNILTLAYLFIGISNYNVIVMRSSVTEKLSYTPYTCGTHHIQRTGFLLGRPCSSTCIHGKLQTQESTPPGSADVGWLKISWTNATLKMQRLTVEISAYSQVPYRYAAHQ